MHSPSLSRHPLSHYLAFFLFVSTHSLYHYLNFPFMCFSLWLLHKTWISWEQGCVHVAHDSHCVPDIHNASISLYPQTVFSPLHATAPETAKTPWSLIFSLRPVCPQISQPLWWLHSSVYLFTLNLPLLTLNSYGQDLSYALIFSTYNSASPAVSTNQESVILK